MVICVIAGKCNGPIHLKSHIELHLSEGTFIKFSPDPELYLPAVRTRWEGVEIRNYSPMIYGFGLTDVAITGKGVIAGANNVSSRPPHRESEITQASRALVLLDSAMRYVPWKD